jgi:hypothetical protein
VTSKAAARAAACPACGDVLAVGRHESHSAVNGEMRQAVPAIGITELMPLRALPNPAMAIMP